MLFVNVRNFKIHATRYLNTQEEIVITRYGKPIARVIPEAKESLSEILLKAGKILKDVGITEKEALATVARVRQKRRDAIQKKSRS